MQLESANECQIRVACAGAHSLRSYGTEIWALLGTSKSSFPAHNSSPKRPAPLVHLTYYTMHVMDKQPEGSGQCLAGTNQPHKDLWLQSILRNGCLQRQITVYLDAMERFKAAAFKNPELNSAC